MSWSRAHALVALTVVLAACSGSSKQTPVADTVSDVNAAGDIPDTQVFVSVTDARGPFTIKVPEGWGRRETSDVTTFSDNFNSIELRVTPSTAAPTESSARQDEVPAIQSVATGFGLDGVTTVQRKAGRAVLITYRADSAPSAVTGKVIKLAVERYEFWQNGKEGLVVLSGPVGADNVDPWKIVTDSFAWG